MHETHSGTAPDDDTKRIKIRRLSDPVIFHCLRCGGPQFDVRQGYAVRARQDLETGGLVMEEAKAGKILTCSRCGRTIPGEEMERGFSEHFRAHPVDETAVKEHVAEHHPPPQPSETAGG